MADALPANWLCGGCATAWSRYLMAVATGARRALTAAATAVILTVGLYPVGGHPQELLLCIFCGDTGLSDAIANVLLFLPLGIALALRGIRPARLVLIGALLSLGIEGAQLVIPGRDPSVGDVLMNTAGAALGALIVASHARWLRPSPRAAGWLSLGASVFLLITVAVTGFLLTPGFPQSLYYAQWTPNLGHLEWYRGRVFRARIGSLSLRDGPIAESGRLREALAAGARLEVQALAGPQVPGLASLFSIADERQRGIVLLGIDRDDLVYRYRTRSATMRLVSPDLRLRDRMRGVAPGDSLSVSVWRGARGECISLNGVAACGIGYTPGAGWGFVYYSGFLPGWIVTLLNGAWIAALALPIGFWARRGLLTATGLVTAFGTLTVLPPAVDLLSTPGVEWSLGVSGLLAGLLARYWLTRSSGQGSVPRRTPTDAVSHSSLPRSKAERLGNDLPS